MVSWLHSTYIKRCWFYLQYVVEQSDPGHVSSGLGELQQGADLKALSIPSVTPLEKSDGRRHSQVSSRECLSPPGLDSIGRHAGEILSWQCLEFGFVRAFWYAAGTYIVEEVPDIQNQLAEAWE